MCDTHYCADEQTVAYQPIVCADVACDPAGESINEPTCEAINDPAKTALAACDSGWEMSTMAVAISQSLRSSQDGSDTFDASENYTQTILVSTYVPPEPKYFKARDTGIRWGDDSDSD